jgi:hypothetical protein
VLQTKLERVLARFLTKLGQNGDVTPDQGLQVRRRSFRKLNATAQ